MFGGEGPSGTVIVDLDGRSIRSTDIEVYAGADVTLRNGVLEDNATVYGGKLTIARDATVGWASVGTNGGSEPASSALIINGKVGYIVDGELVPNTITATYGTLEINDGAKVGDIEVPESCKVNINGGEVKELFVSGDDTTVNISGGSVETFKAYSDDTDISITGGEIGTLDASEYDPSIEISGGTFGSSVPEKYLAPGMTQASDGSVGVGELEVTLSATKATYDGTNHKPTLTKVMLGDKDVTADAELTWESDETEFIDAGTYNGTVKYGAASKAVKF